MRRPSHQSQSLIRPPDCKCQAGTVQSRRSCSSAANRKGRKDLTVSSACLVFFFSKGAEYVTSTPGWLSSAPSLAHRGTSETEADQQRWYHTGGISRLFCPESVLLNKVGEKDFSLNRKFSLALQGMRSCDRLKKEQQVRKHCRPLHPGSLIRQWL